MDSFKFKARRQNGELVAGTVNAENEAGVAAYIRNQGLVVTKIEKAKSEKEYFWSGLMNKGITLYDVAIFCRQFATLVGAGVSLITALDILIDQTDNPSLKKVIGAVAQEVHKGSSLSVSMNMFPKVFPELMVNMIEAGETGGILETVLHRLADQYEKDYRLNSRLKSAMVYPAVVLGISVIVVGIILTFVMPTFTGMFKALNTELPWPTRLVMSASDVLRNYWWALFIIIILLYAGYRQLEKNKEFCLWRDKVYLKLPVFGELYNKIIITRFSSTFAGLSRSGVPILTALTVVSKATGSLQAELVLREARSNVQRGRGLAEPMEKSGMFPPIVVNMVSIGEETGSLDYMLDKITEFYTAEVDDMMGRLQSLLDPFLIVIMGVVVGFVAIAMMLPMFEMVTKVGGM